MTASIASMATAEYYLSMTESLHPATEYYVGGIEPDGMWYNPTNQLNLVNGGRINPREFTQLFNGFSPEGIPLTRNSGKENRATGLDITFSADKSISSLWAISSEETREKIQNCLQAAAIEGLDYLQDNASFCRRGEGGKNIEKCSFMAGTFRHSTSREMDPQLHIHSTIFNIGFRQDGTTGSLDQPAFFRHYHTSGAVFRNALARELRHELGLNFERHGKKLEFTRIVGFPKDLEELWSKRRKMIVSRASELGLDTSNSGAATSTIAVSSRADKTQDNTQEELIERFHSEALSLGYSEDIIEDLIHREFVFKKDELIQDLLLLPNKLLKTEAVFQELNFVKEFKNALCGQLKIAKEEELFNWVKNETQLVYLGVNHKNERIYSTPQMIFSELSVKDMSRSLQNNLNHQINNKITNAKLQTLKDEKVFLSSEQRDAFEYVTSFSGSVAVMEGAAGAGKSKVLESISATYKENGFDVIGCSTTWKVATELGDDCKIDSYAIDKLLHDIEIDKITLTKKSVLIVEEVGTLSTSKMKQLLKVVKGSGSKIILSGDREQQQSIEAGSGLRLVQSVETGVRIDRIRRQRASVEDILVYRDKLRTLDRSTARLQEAMMLPEAKDDLIKKYRETVERYGVVWQREASNFLKNGDDEKALALYYERGNIKFGRNRGSAIWKLSSDWVEWVKANPKKTSLVQALTNQEAMEITTAIRKILQQNGMLDTKEYKIEVSGNSELERNTLLLARGDFFIFGMRNDDLEVVNGTRAEVLSINEDPLGLIIDAKIGDRKVSFRPSDMATKEGIVKLKSGYCTTIFSGQGTTVDATFNFVNHKLTREGAYSVGTRHRDECYFYMDRDLSEEFVRQGRNEQDRDLPVKEKEILEAIGKKWSISHQKDLVHDHMDEMMIAKYKELYSLLGEGESVHELLSTDVAKRERNRLAEIDSSIYKGEDLKARITVSKFGVIRADAAVLGEKIRSEIQDKKEFYSHREYKDYQKLRFMADEVAANINDNLSIHREALKNYPNVTDEQLKSAFNRHNARVKVNAWLVAIEGKKEATASRLAHEIVEETKLEKESQGKGYENSFVTKALMDLSVNRSTLYRSAEDHRESLVREKLSPIECEDRDKVLDYRRSSYTVGKVYSQLRELAGEGVNISEHSGYSLLQNALANRDVGALTARGVSDDVLKSLAVDRNKLEQQAAMGEARKLVASWNLQEDKGSIEQRDALADQIVSRLKFEKDMAAELESVDPDGQHKLEKITSRAAMEKGMDWKRLFAQSHAHKERVYLNSLSVDAQNVHRDVKRYRELEREVGKCFANAASEAKEQNIDKQNTQAWKNMQKAVAVRDRLAHSLVTSKNNLASAVEYYKGDEDKLIARADRITAVDLIDSYTSAKATNDHVMAGKYAQDILARVFVEKADQKSKVISRELFARDVDWKELKADRKAYNLSIENEKSTSIKIGNEPQSLQEWHSNLSEEDKIQAALGKLSAPRSIDSISASETRSLEQGQITMREWHNSLSEEEKIQAALGNIKAPRNVVKENRGISKGKGRKL